MRKANIFNHQQGIRYHSLTISICLIVLFVLSGCSGKNRMADRYADNMAKMEAINTGQKTEKSLENLAPDKLIKEGNNYLANGNHEIAKLHFAMAVKKKPSSVDACFGLGRAFILEGKMQKAYEILSQALLIDPDHKDSLLAVAKILRGKGKYDAAFKLLNKAVASYPDDPEIITELAITHDAAGQEDEAEPFFLKVVELIPQQAAPYNNLGFNYLLQKKYDQAVTEFNKARQREYNNTRILNNLAMAYIYSGNDEKGVNILKQTVGEAEAYNNLGYIYMLQGKCDRAKKAYQNALDSNPLYYVRANSNRERLSSCDSRLTPELSEKTFSGSSAKMLAVEEKAFALNPKESEEKTSYQGKKSKKIKVVKVTAGRFRGGPSLEADVLGYLKRDERVAEIGRKKSWYFVRLEDGRLGWAHRSLFASTAGDDVSSKNDPPATSLSVSVNVDLSRQVASDDNQNQTHGNFSEDTFAVSGPPEIHEVSGQTSKEQSISGGKI